MNQAEQQSLNRGAVVENIGNGIRSVVVGTANGRPSLVDAQGRRSIMENHRDYFLIASGHGAELLDTEVNILDDAADAMAFALLTIMMGDIAVAAKAQHDALRNARNDLRETEACLNESHAKLHKAHAKLNPHTTYRITMETAKGETSNMGGNLSISEKEANAIAANIAAETGRTLMVETIENGRIVNAEVING